MAQVERKSSGRACSADFVEHLRTVHFALTALAFTLVSLAYLANEHISRARTEVSELQRVRDNWNQMRHELYRQAAQIDDAPLSPNQVVIDVATRKDRLIFPVSIQQIPADDTLENFLPPSVARPLDTIADFQSWWDSILATGLNVHVLESGQTTRCTIFDDNGISQNPDDSAKCSLEFRNENYGNETSGNRLPASFARDGQSLIANFYVAHVAPIASDKKYNVLIAIDAKQLTVHLNAIRSFFPKRAWRDNVKLDTMDFASRRREPVRNRSPTLLRSSARLMTKLNEFPYLDRSRGRPIRC
jgi:hypothetical protein